ATAVSALPSAVASPLPATTGAGGSAPGFGALLLSAFLGGIILNLMPCVFPVLAMKALSLARLSGLQRREQRLSALFYTLGILLAFLVLGGLILGLREAGRTVGWGIQFQSPIFVAATCWVLFAVGLNLLGVFEVGGRLAGAGQSFASRGGHGGDFATGLLAVLVATPCAAPFMVTAVAGALAAPAIVALPVFLFMGLGLALPYVVFALVPRLVRLLPRPGAWMEILKQALSFPVFATCVWLLWVASFEAGANGVLAIAAGLVLLGAAAWLFGLSQRMSFAAADGPEGRRPARFAAMLALGCVLVTLALLRGLAGAAPTEASASATPAGWEAFSEDRLAALRAQHRPVLVDMSAAWCVSCLVNEKVAFNSAAVRTAFRAHDVALLRGDWTNRDAGIAAFLRAHGRDGVPFYLYVSADGTEHVWPQILTPGLVQREIDRG
ncbi:MAG: thioredoxin family protein, partial [Gluconacetobacter diazotrophicus]|nr:thioredoxin family protein [Gluconacetobacter diazotrophicus]